MTAERDRLVRWAPLIVALSAMLVYANALANGFVLDDQGVITENPLVMSLDGMWRAFVNPYWPEALGGYQYRPLAIAGFTIDWAVSAGSPTWFHAVNMLWHAAATVAVWYLAIAILAPAGALATALLFALHPVHVEAVANVVGRLECMAAVFTIVALLAHRRGSRAAIPLFALGLLSKENAIVFLGLAGAHDLLIAGPWRTALRDRRVLYASYGATVVLYAGLLAYLFRDGGFTTPSLTFDGAGTWQRLLTVATVVPRYVMLLLLPTHLSADYQPGVILPVTSPLDPLVLLGVMLAVTLAVAIGRAWRRTPQLAFALVWVPITLAPVSNVVFVSGVTLAERTLYLPSVGAMLLLGWAIQHLALRHVRPVLATAALLLAFYAARTWTRTPAWRDNRTFLLTLLRDHPESYRAHSAAAKVFASQGQLDAASRELATARHIFPRDPGNYTTGAEVAMERGDYATAALLLDSAMALRPGLAKVHLRRADVGYLMGDFREAIAAAERGLVLAPDSARARVLIALAARELADTATAERAYREGIRHSPGVWELRLGYADVLLARGDTARALEQVTHAVELSSGGQAALAFRDRIMGGSND
ncbi:MAG TPA: tetratricopeptide repeat protein [Gemmatimonadaceae bacterium]|nr:tetratricopeptide repeat protein [Gemmatimonadaceae bacterium]